MTTLVLIPFNETEATQAPSFTSDLINSSASIVGSLWNNITNDTSNNNTQDPYGYFVNDEYDSGYGFNVYSSADKRYGDGYYYGKMSVAVLTLGLVIVVEFMLRRIDAFAVGKPFGLAVLEAVYRECK
jgi:hypothetical protein